MSSLAGCAREGYLQDGCHDVPLSSWSGTSISCRPFHHVLRRRFSALSAFCKPSPAPCTSLSSQHHRAFSIAGPDKGCSVRALFVDFSKAFDRVDHNVIVSKLIYRGVPLCLIRWLCSYLNERRQAVRIDGQFSQWRTLAGGMPQGSLIGPLTFILLIDDLRLHCLTHKYVDDTTLSEL